MRVLRVASEQCRQTYTWEFAMANAKESHVSGKESPAVVSDSGRVGIGSSSPAFPPARGGPANTSDTGKIRIGSSSPAFPPVQSR
jgi:hypothetical protein